MASYEWVINIKQMQINEKYYCPTDDLSTFYEAKQIEFLSILYFLLPEKPPFLTQKNSRLHLN